MICQVCLTLSPVSRFCVILQYYVLYGEQAVEAAERLWALMSTGTAFDQGLRHLCFQVRLIGVD